MDKESMKKIILIWRKKPVIFAKQALGFNPDEWQSGALNDIRDHDQVAIRSGQGVGKTSVEAVIILWFLVCFSNAKVICTAPTKQQLNEVLWAEVSKWLTDSKIKNILKWTKTKVYMIGSEQRWFATAKTATRPENMQGFHEDNMLFVVDEASGIDDRIMEAILGTLSGNNNKIIMMANPTKTSGIFFDAFHKDRTDWKTRKVSSLDSSRTNKKNIERLIRRYGKESDVVRVRVFGDFPKGEPNAWISLSDVEAAMSRELPEDYSFDGEDYEIPEYAPIDIGLDVARFGDDETVMATRLGAVCLPLKFFTGQNLMKTVGVAIEEANRLHEKYPSHHIRIKLDDTGVGGGVTDRLNEIKYEDDLDWLTIHPINFASKGNRDYDGIISLMYGRFKDDYLEDVVLPQDDDLAAQMSIRRYSMTSKGKVLIERKKEMKKRGLPSPDRAEAVVMAFYEPPEVGVQFLKGGI
ncbi:DEAD/DEAH box helicase family protein [Enterococcus dispar]|uniref:DEAD/DEAH box helicase family protein n=1 Tax=Enterococcus dispar TaxID=44009 RepID=UPI0021D43590|nr:DEAD/DEAH box helicase family protein [Enterococcus dispar]MCU7356709.1 DEAD/DEAH box helicase family protein [Enterococcus dispar]